MSEEAPASDLNELLAINYQIGGAESRANRAYFESLLHPHFTMRRPGGQWASRDEFLDGLTSGTQRHTVVQQVELHGHHRGVARCRVEKWSQTAPQDVQVFDNLRVFVKTDERWQLVCWLTEPA